MKKWIIASSALSVLCFIYLIYPTDERRIIKVIQKSESAVVSKNIDALMGHVSYNYRDNYGNNYLQIKEIVRTIFSRLNNFQIDRNITKISVKDNIAEVEMFVSVIASAGEDRGYILGDAGQAAEIKVFFEKSSYKWLITKVEGVFEQSRGAF